MADDILDDSAWFDTVRSTQLGGLPPLSTSESHQDTPRLDMTTFTVSEYMQGSALYAPNGVAYSVAKDNILDSFQTLLGNKEYSKYINPTSLATLPLQLQAQAQMGDTTPADPTTSPDGGATTGINSGTQVPPELVKYGNGKIPVEMLLPTGFSDYKLYRPAAIMFRNLVAAATKDGITIGVTSAYRDYTKQAQLRQAEGIMAAPAGTSNHGWGLAVDLSWENNSQDVTTKGYQWMNANAARYGFAHPDWAKEKNEGGTASPAEAWHWEYRGDLNIGK